MHHIYLVCNFQGGRWLGMTWGPSLKYYMRIMVMHSIIENCHFYTQRLDCLIPSRKRNYELSKIKHHKRAISYTSHNELPLWLGPTWLTWSTGHKSEHKPHIVFFKIPFSPSWSRHKEEDFTHKHVGISHFTHYESHPRKTTFDRH